MLKLITAASLFFVSQVGTAEEPTAKFTPIKTMRAKSAQAFVDAVKPIVKNVDVFGDASYVGTFSFTRKETEEDINSVKQLNFAKGEIDSDDRVEAVSADQSAEALAEHLLYAINNSIEETNVFVTARKSLIKALNDVKADSTLQIFKSNHAFEDGSWQILTILDVKNAEVLLVKIGYYGT